jgi:hypothetical protein
MGSGGTATMVAATVAAIKGNHQPGAEAGAVVGPDAAGAQVQLPKRGGRGVESIPRPMAPASAGHC